MLTSNEKGKTILVSGATPDSGLLSSDFTSTYLTIVQ